MMERRSSVSRTVDLVNSVLQAATTAVLLVLAAMGFTTTTTNEAVRRLAPWWRGYATTCVVLAVLWSLHAWLHRYVPVMASISLAIISSVVMVFGAALFRPVGWGAVFWLPFGLFIAIAITAFLGPVSPRGRSL